jgi:predicted metal-dependent hydrolase
VVVYISKKIHYKLHKNRATRLIKKRVGEIALLYGVKLRKIAIRNQKSRWGSCSKNGNLNFNYKLIFLAPELCDYVIVHEICHLIEFNHSARFWAQVAKTVPDYSIKRKVLRSVNLNKLGFQ